MPFPYSDSESIIDCLLNAIDEYDREISKTSNIWRRYIADNEGISELRKLSKKLPNLYYFNEQGTYVDVLEQLSDIIDRRKLRTPDGGDELTKRIFDKLLERIQFFKQKQRRTPTDLTTDYKILLVADGWRTEHHAMSPTAVNIQQALALSPYRDDVVKHFRDERHLRKFGFDPQQVYTIDIDPNVLPDMTTAFQFITKPEFPQKHFDLVYFEGITLSEHDRQTFLEIALHTLKDDGLMIYSTSRSMTKLVAKTGIITQEKLNNIPEVIGRALKVRRGGYAKQIQLENVKPNGTENIILSIDREPADYNKPIDPNYQGMMVALEYNRDRMVFDKLKEDRVHIREVSDKSLSQLAPDGHAHLKLKRKTDNKQPRLQPTLAIIEECNKNEIDFNEAIANPRKRQ